MHRLVRRVFVVSSLVWLSGCPGGSDDCDTPHDPAPAPVPLKKPREKLADNDIENIADTSMKKIREKGGQAMNVASPATRIKIKSTCATEFVEALKAAMANSIDATVLVRDTPMGPNAVFLNNAIYRAVCIENTDTESFSVAYQAYVEFGKIDTPETKAGPASEFTGAKPDPAKPEALLEASVWVQPIVKYHLNGNSNDGWGCFTPNNAAQDTAQCIVELIKDLRKTLEDHKCEVVGGNN